MRAAPPAASRVPVLVFLGFFAGYLAWSIGVVSLGVLAAVAHHNPGLHASLHDQGLTDTLWGRMASRTADASHRSENWAGLAIDFAFSVINIALAIFLVWLRPRDRTARLLAIGIVGTAAVFNLQAHTVYEVQTATRFEAFSHDTFHLIAAVAYVLALLLFPDGRLVPRWQRWRLTAFYLLAVGAAALLARSVHTGSRTVTLIVLFGVLTPLVGVAAQGYRYRRAPTAIEHQQSRLLFWALAPALIVGVLALVVGLSNAGGSGLEGRSLVVIPTNIFRVFQPVFGLIPIALMVGILRFRLWNIDRVISRTLVYSALAGFVSAVYVAVVVGIGSLLGNQDTGNLWLSIAATGIVAVAFQPVKERVQKLADRLVYGHRSTPYEVLSEFSEKVAETPATDELLARMARILAEGTTARRADVWLLVGGELRVASSWPEDDGHRPEALKVTGEEIPWIDNVTSAVAVRHQGELFGALSVTKPPNEGLSPTEQKLLDDLGRQAGLVLRNVRLTAELMARLEELRASRQRLVAAQDAERRRLERNLHDGAQQQLVSLKVQLSLAETMAGELEGEEAAGLAEMLGALKVQTGEALEEVRDLARACTRRCSPPKACPSRSRVKRARTACRLRSRPTGSVATTRRSKRRSTSAASKRCRTFRNTRARQAPRSPSPRRPTRCGSRCRTTASGSIAAAWRTAPGVRTCPTASKRSTARSPSLRSPVRAPRSGARSPPGRPPGSARPHSAGTLVQ